MFLLKRQRCSPEANLRTGLRDKYATHEFITILVWVAI